MEDDCSGGQSQQTLAQNQNSNENGKRKIGLCDRTESGFKGIDEEKADEEDCGVEEWSSLSNIFNQVQSVLDQNNILIRKVNENQQSKIPDNLAKNVALIREMTTNISKVVSLYSDLSDDFSSMIHQRRGTSEISTKGGINKDGEVT